MRSTYASKMPRIERYCVACASYLGTSASFLADVDIILTHVLRYDSHVLHLRLKLAIFEANVLRGGGEGGQK